MRHKRGTAPAGSADLVASLDGVARRLDGLAREVDTLVGAAVTDTVTFERTG